jgi:hypothetical protein
MTVAHPPSHWRSYRPGPQVWRILVQLIFGILLALALALALVGPERLIAQIEGDRGIIATAISSDIHIGGIAVETTGKDANEARQNGWKLAERMGWQMLKGPPMTDSQIESMVAAVVIEHEQIGPHRYVAKLGVLFDRDRAGQFLVSNQAGSAINHSAPMLVIPVLYSGGVAQTFEVSGIWQKAWADARAANSTIDYVRPTGSGGDSLILTAGQSGRRSRLWWRNVLNQFGASDVISPVARLERQWPGGPVRGTFTARYGPDNTYLDSFTLSANDEVGVASMLNQAVERFDRIYSDALGHGLLRPDSTLYSDQQTLDSALAALVAAIQPKPASVGSPTALPSGTGSVIGANEAPPKDVAVSSVTVQFASPDAQAVDAALGAVRSAAGVKSAATSSIAIGGTSVMRVSYAGELQELATALRARGWQVSVGSNSLSIRR